MIGLFNGALDCPLLPLDAPCGFLLGGDEVAFDRPLRPGEVFGLVDLEGGFAILEAMGGDFLAGRLTLRQTYGPVQRTASQCMHCDGWVEARQDQPSRCPGCGREVVELGPATAWRTVFDRAQAVRKDRDLRGTFVLQASEQEDGRLRAAFYLQPRGASSLEECLVFIDETFERPAPLDLSGMSAGEKARAAWAADTFDRAAAWVESHCGGDAIIGPDGSIV
jgi:hypothetical protein